MLINKFISCRTCNEKINIRIQAEDNRIPFIVNCPKCSTEISVEIDYVNQKISYYDKYKGKIRVEEELKKS